MARSFIVAVVLSIFLPGAHAVAKKEMKKWWPFDATTHRDEDALVQSAPTPQRLQATNRVKSIVSQAKSAAKSAAKSEAGTLRSFSTLKSGIEELQHSMKDQENATIQDLNSHKEVYEQHLDSQRTENANMEATNMELERTLEELESSIPGLRATAEALVVDNENITAQLQKLAKHVETASELVGRALNVSHENLVAAPQVRILEEVAQRQNQFSHEKELRQYKGARKIAMLGVAARSLDEDPDAMAEELVRQIGESVEASDAVRHASLAKLKMTYDQLSADAAAHKKLLVQRQVKLNASIQAANDTNVRLAKAVQYLTDTKVVLSERLDAVRVFGSTRLGKAEVQTGDLQLLEMSASRLHTSVDTVVVPNEELVQELLHDLHLWEGPTKAFEDLKESLAELSDNVKQQENASMEDIQSHQVAYKGKLVAQRHDLQVEALAINEMEVQLTDADIEVDSLRHEAYSILQQNEALTEELKRLQAKISTAQELLKGALNVSTGLEQDPRLQVLVDLAEADERQAHEQELQKIELAPVSLLTMSTHNVTQAVLSTTPDDAVRLMSATLDQAMTQRNTTLIKLNDGFDKLYAEGIQQHVRMAAQQAHLIEALESTNDFKRRLVAAVEHLNKTKVGLSERVAALHAFGQVHAFATRSDDAGASREQPRILPQHYQMLSFGDSNCPKGYEIQTQEECEAAVAALGKATKPTWTTPMRKIPMWCSLKAGDCGKSACAHFNKAPSGSGRADLAPICLAHHSLSLVSR